MGPWGSIFTRPMDGGRTLLLKEIAPREKMNEKYRGPLVSANWLHEHLEDPEICIVDASVHLPDT